MVGIKLEGGLGNNLFQIAFLYSFAKKHGLDYCVSKEVINPHVNGNKYTFPGINYCDSQPLLSVFTEPCYEYTEFPKIENVCFRGFFQSWKYHYGYRDELLKAFGFDDIETKEKICAIHVRRGDYLDFPSHHPAITPVYLFKAIVFMIDDGYRKFKMFSDDIGWCKKVGGSFDFKDVEIEYSEGNDELGDLREMASCSSIVTSNSSFSWWGAYINPNPDKKIVMPSIWFGEALNHNTADLYLPNAVII